jgi:hypothetical protein
LVKVWLGSVSRHGNVDCSVSGLHTGDLSECGFRFVMGLHLTTNGSVMGPHLTTNGFVVACVETALESLWDYTRLRCGLLSFVWGLHLTAL